MAGIGPAILLRLDIVIYAKALGFSCLCPWTFVHERFNLISNTFAKSHTMGHSRASAKRRAFCDSTRSMKSLSSSLMYPKLPWGHEGSDFGKMLINGVHILCAVSMYFGKSVVFDSFDLTHFRISSHPSPFRATFPFVCHGAKWMDKIMSLIYPPSSYYSWFGYLLQ